jgi:hypothetical protein
MLDFPETIVSCSAWQELVGAVNTIKRSLQPEQRKVFSQVFSGYLAKYGLEGAYQRMNGRRLFDIVAGYDPRDLKVIASGEVDGVRFELSERPSEEATSEGTENP